MQFREILSLKPRQMLIKCVLCSTRGMFGSYWSSHPATDRAVPPSNVAPYCYCSTANVKIAFSAKAGMPSTAITGVLHAPTAASTWQTPAFHSSWTPAPPEVLHNSSASLSWLFECAAEISWAAEAAPSLSLSFPHGHKKVQHPRLYLEDTCLLFPLTNEGGHQNSQSMKYLPNTYAWRAWTQQDLSDD